MSHNSMAVSSRNLRVVALLLTVLAFLVAMARFSTELENLLPPWPSLRMEWCQYILTSVLPAPFPAVPAVAWPDGWGAQDLQHPRNWLEAQMPILVASRSGTGHYSGALLSEEVEGDLSDNNSEMPPDEPALEQQPADNTGVQVFIYNTHTSESYIPESGIANLEGQRGGVTEVAASLGKALEAEGIKVVVSSTIHDYPDYLKSYTNSLVTVKKALAQYPSLQVLLDVHRDAGQTKPVTAVIGDRKVARILLVIGKVNPNWEDNLAYANQIKAKMDKLYPGLSLGVRVQNGRYNQHLLPRAILVEIGNSLNTQDEANASADLLARVLKEIM